MFTSFVRNAFTALPIGILMATPGVAQDLVSFGLISGQSLTNTGPTTIVGNIAVSPGTSYTGSGSVTQTGTTYIADGVAGRAQDDLVTLYNLLAGRPTSNGGDLTGQDLGGLTLLSGVYNFDTSAGIAAGQTLTLDGGGDPDAIFIINIGTTLTANSGSKVILQNGAQGGNVFFRVGSSATLDTTANLVGQIVALTSVTMNTAAAVNCGAVFARNGSVTLDTNTIRICTLAADEFDDLPDEGDYTASQRAVAAALKDYGAGLPVGFLVLAATQTPDELAASLAQLSGETVTALDTLAMQPMDGFLDSVLLSGRRQMSRSQAARDVGVPVGMVPDKINAPYTGKYGSGGDAALSYALPPVVEQNFSVWVAGYGSRSVVDGDTAIGAHDLTVTDRGLAAGLNYTPGDGVGLGIALSMNTAHFDLNQDFGSGRSDSLFLALRGRTTSGSGYLEGAVAMGKSDIETNRTLTVAEIDQFNGQTKGRTLAAHLEAGYRIGMVTPYAALRAKTVKTDAFSETTVSGSSSYALSYGEDTARSLRSELGVGISWPSDLTRAGGASFGLRAAWAHEFADAPASTATFISVPDVSFPVSGAAADRNSLVLAANMQLLARNGFTVDGEVSAEYGGNTRDISGVISAGYRW